MKKIFTLMAAAVMALAVNAKDFNDKLVLDITIMTSEQHLEQTSTISIDEVANSDGLYDITLKDFSFGDMSLGDIKIVNVKGNSDTDGFVTFEKNEQPVKVNLFGKEQEQDVRTQDEKTYRGERHSLRNFVRGVCNSRVFCGAVKKEFWRRARVPAVSFCGEL